MNKAELLTSLRLQCWQVIENPLPFGGIQDETGNASARAAGEPWAAAATERRDSNGAVVQTLYFTGAANEYKWRTIQMAPRGTRKPQNIHILVTDEGTDQEEATLVGAPVELPVGDTLVALQYLESLKGTEWNSYEYVSSRADLGFLILRAWVDAGNGTEAEKLIRVFRDASNNPTHAEIV